MLEKLIILIKLKLFGVAEAKCFGVKKTQIVNEEEVVEAISKTIKEVRSGLKYDN